MKYRLTILGAGSLIGQCLCRRAIRLGWDVNAFSMFNLSKWAQLRKKILYQDDGLWHEHVAWTESADYDENFERLHENIRNVEGLIYLYEPTPLLKKTLDPERTFEKNAIKLAGYAGEWSVRHFIAVEDKDHHGLIGKETENAIGEAHPYLIVSLLRPGHVFSHEDYVSCLPIWKSEMIKAIGGDPPQLDCIEAEKVAKVITTLVHNSSDANVYRVMDSKSMKEYLKVTTRTATEEGEGEDKDNKKEGE